jgi:hypothetical protein
MSKGKLVLLFTGVFSVSVHAQTTYSAVTSNEDLGQYGQFVIHALLRDVGLEGIPDDEKRDEDEQVPDGDAQPIPAEEETDDFFDDDFFDDDVGFDEAVAEFDREFDETVAAWDSEYEATLERWGLAKREYDQEKEQLMALTYDLESMVGNIPLQSPALPAASGNVDLATMQPGDYHVIPHAMDIDIRNQVLRGTCAAFAGVRALEIVLWQHELMRTLQVDLSEQHFYWMSRDTCMDAPCTASVEGEGSSPLAGLVASQTQQRELALMMERDCPYNPYPNDDNLSYTPLNNCNFNGQFHAGQITPGLDLSGVISELSRNRPVVAGFTLNNSYKETKGLVRARDPVNATKATGDHVSGHAMVLIGYMKLPEQYWSEEGTYCAIMANSWGVGFGIGGYACLTEQWMKENQMPPSNESNTGFYISVSSVQSRL